MRYLEPLKLQERYYARIETEIQRVFYHLIFMPLVKIMRMRHADFVAFSNSENALISAIRLGRVWYEDGQFRGQFSAKISLELKRIGARYDGRTRTWHAGVGDVPSDIKFAQATADARYVALKEKLVRALDDVDVDGIDLISKTQAHYEKTITEIEADMHATIPAKLAERDADHPASARTKIAIESDLSVEQVRRIAEEWGDNLDLYIKGWAKENILKLRAEISPQILAGGRAESLVKAIQENYGVAARKAKFLARQETALLMTSYQKNRYLDMGITKFKWSTSHDSRVRHDHRALNGKIFDINSPPVVDRRTGKRALPGQDWGCRMRHDSNGGVKSIWWPDHKLKVKNLAA